MRARQSMLISSFVCAIVALGSQRCLAGSDALTDKAATLYDEGMAAYGKGKWPQARASFLAAWSLKNHWQIAGSLGDCEVQLGLYREAAAHLAYFLRLAPPERRTAAAQRLYDDARSKVGALAISVDVAEADIAVDGKVIGKAPLEDPVFVEPGHHVVEARSGARIASAQVDVRAGERREIGLKPAAVETPVTPSGPGRGWIIASGVTAAGGFVAGIALTVAANGKASDASSLRAQVGGRSACTASPAPSPCADLQSAVSSKVTLSNAAVGTFVVGGAFALATVGLGVWQSMAPKKTAALRVVPVVGAGEGGIVVVGSW